MKSKKLGCRIHTCCSTFVDDDFGEVITESVDDIAVFVSQLDVLELSLTLLLNTHSRRLQQTIQHSFPVSTFATN